MVRKVRDLLLVLAMILVLSAFAGCATGWYSSYGSGPKHTGSGVQAGEPRDVEQFDSISVMGSIDVVADIGGVQQVELNGDDNLLELCITEVEDRTLTVRMEEGSYRFKEDMTVVVSMPELRAIAIAGSSDVTIRDYDGAALELAIAGSGDIVANGSVDQLRAVVSGSGDLRLTDLVAREATVSVSGSGDIDVHATETLDCAVSGSGDIRYRGNPQASMRISGTGSIRPH